MNEIENNLGTLAKLPLWKHLADRIMNEGLHYGKEFPAEFFEEGLRLKRTEKNFVNQLCSIRRYIFNQTGFCLHGYGSKGKFQRIIEPSQNLHKGHLLMRTAKRRIRDTVKITQTTVRDTLTTEERRAMERLELGSSRKLNAFLQTDHDLRKQKLLNEVNA